MATRNIVPRANGEGQIGTAAKKWNKIYTDILYVGENSIEVAIGRPIFDVILRPGYIKANGAAVADASTAIPRLLAFVQANPSLLAENQAAYDANHGLYLYDSVTDTLTLPDYIGRGMQGGNTVEEKEAGLPNIKGSIGSGVGSAGSEIGAFRSDCTAGAFSKLYDGQYNPSRGNQPISGTVFTAIKFDASDSNSIYSDTVNTVQPPAITLIPQIRY